MLLDVTVPGEPVGKGRPRVVTRDRRGQPLAKPRGITPEKTATWEAGAVVLLRNAWKFPPLDEPVVLVVEAVAGRRKSDIPSARQLARDPALGERCWRTVKPDGDNVLKCVGDALVAAGVIRDDTLVVDWRCLSLTAAMTDGPSVRVVLHRAPPRP